MSPIVCEKVTQAVWALQRGALIAYPTEAVWGLGCDPFSAQAVAQVLAIKGRDSTKGLIVVAAHVDQLDGLIDWSSVPAGRQRTILDQWPGPFTWVFRAGPKVPVHLMGPEKTLAVRVSAHPLVRTLCLQWGGPIISTSANPSTHPAALTLEEVKGYFKGHSLVVVDGDLGEQRRPSQVADAQSGEVYRR